MKTMSLAILTIVMVACSSADGQKTPANAAKTPVKPAKSKAGISEFELKHGIGPIKEELKLAPINSALAKNGEKTFETKCFSCHRLDDRYVGPPLRDVTKRRTPEFIINMILNPDEMTKRHPETKKLLAEYMTPMTFQNVSRDEALSILEYFRKAATEKK